MNHIIFNVSAPCDEHTTAKMLYVALSYIYIICNYEYVGRWLGGVGWREDNRNGIAIKFTNR